jgi:class 3 adenylate cyclase
MRYPIAKDARVLAGEPVRGSIPPSWFWALPGIDRVRAFSQGLLLTPPLARLQGIHAAHVGPGSGTWTMPASGWLQGPTDLLEISAFVETALTGVTLTAAPPGIAVVPRTLAINYFRPCRPEAGNLLARGRVVNTSSFFAFTELEIEDPEGRHIAHAAGQSAFRPVEPPPPPPPSMLLSVEEPLYSTPDPYLRSALPQVAAPEEWLRHAGLAVMRRYLDSTCVMPLAQLYGIRLLAVDEGRVVATLPASEWFGRFSRNVAPGILGALAAITVWGAWLTLFRPGDSFTCLEQIYRFYRDVPCDGRTLRAEARVVGDNRDLSMAETSVYDADGILVVSQSGTGAFIEEARRRQRPQVEAKRILATLLFTDVVGSTDHANRLGDARWRTLLDEHRAVVRREIARCAGIEIDTAGDGFFVRFESPARAIECARGVRAAVKRLGIEVRAGIHTGECELQGRGLSGIAVHIAARIQGAAAPGEILVSSTVRDVAAGSALRFEDWGEHTLKGLPDRWRLYALAD